MAKTPHFCTKKCSEDGNNDFVILFNFKSISSIVLREPIKNYLADISVKGVPPHSGQKRGGGRYYLVTLEFKVLLTLICPQN